MYCRSVGTGTGTRIILGYVKKLEASVSIFFNILKPERIETFFKGYNVGLNLTTFVTSVNSYQQVVFEEFITFLLPPFAVFQRVFTSVSGQLLLWKGR